MCVTVFPSAFLWEKELNTCTCTSHSALATAHTQVNQLEISSIVLWKLNCFMEALHDPDAQLTYTALMGEKKQSVNIFSLLQSQHLWKRRGTYLRKTTFVLC